MGSTWAVLLCSGAGKQRVATSCMLVHAVLTAVLEWANYQPVVLASVECLRTMLHYLSSGQHMHHLLLLTLPPHPSKLLTTFSVMPINVPDGCAYKT